MACFLEDRIIKKIVSKKKDFHYINFNIGYNNYCKIAIFYNFNNIRSILISIFDVCIYHAFWTLTVNVRLSALSAYLNFWFLEGALIGEGRFLKSFNFAK